MSGSLTEGFRELIDLRWSDFVEMEQSLDATNFDAVLHSLVRACAKGNLRAIQVALDRLDGKVATEIEVEYPKFYTLYPNATRTADDPAIIEGDEQYMVKYENGTLTVPRGDAIIELSGSPADVEEQEAAEEELPTGSLRAVLEKMMGSPKQIVTDLLDAAARVDKGNLAAGNPMVKSVVVAGLMKLVHDNRISAVFEVFDQIDGKVADSIKLLGDDVYMYDYSMIAPAGAIKNEKGIYQVEAINTTDAWALRLEQTNKKR